MIQGGEDFGFALKPRESIVVSSVCTPALTLASLDSSTPGVPLYETDLTIALR